VSIILQNLEKKYMTCSPARVMSGNMLGFLNGMIGISSLFDAKYKLNTSKNKTINK
jgi:hypothetical protein